MSGGVLAELWVPGRARSKGSMVCQGGRSHHMVEQVKESKPWRIKVCNYVVRYVREMPAAKEGVWPYEGAVELEAMFYFNRPDGEELPYPTVAWLGDLDKLVRNINDAVQLKTGAGLISDDRNVVRIVAEKNWGKHEGVNLSIRERA